MHRPLARRMMRRARWWQDQGLIPLCPAPAQLEATVQPWHPMRLLRQSRLAAARLGANDLPRLPWLGLPLPTAALVRLLVRARSATDRRWLIQLLLAEPDALRRCEAENPGLSTEIKAVRAAAFGSSPPQRSTTSAPLAGLPRFLHRSAQVPVAELGWFACNDVTAAYDGRAWPPANDHFPAALHGHRTVRALRGLFS